jgi:SAM-dependent methyltransferase
MSVASRDQLKDYVEHDYADYWKQGSHVDIIKEQEAKLVRKMLPSSEGWFADFGSGAGRLVPAYDDGKRKPVLIDYVRGAVQQGCSAYPGAALWGVSSDIARLPFRDGVFSGAVAVRLMQNSDDPLPLLKEIGRVLKPGAYIVVSYFNRRSLMRSLRYGLRCFKKTHAFEHKAKWGNMCGTHPTYFKELVKRSGFEIVGRQSGSCFSYQITNNSLLLQKLIERSTSFKNAVSGINAFADAVLGPNGLSLWQFALLLKPAEPGRFADDAMGNDILAIMQCPECGQPDLIRLPGSTACPRCNTSFKREGRVHDMLIAAA